MDAGAVQALVVVLGDPLPVRRRPRSELAGALERGEPVAIEVLEQVADVLVDLGRLAGEVDQHQAADDGEPDRRSGPSRRSRSPRPRPCAAPPAARRRGRRTRRGRDSAGACGPCPRSPRRCRAPRWRQTLRKARGRPSSPPITTTLSAPSSRITNLPGSSTAETWPTQTQPRKMLSSSHSSTAVIGEGGRAAASSPARPAAGVRATSRGSRGRVLGVGSAAH